MWFWKAVSERRLIVVHLVASFVAVVGMLSHLAFGWAHMTAAWRVGQICILLLLLVSIGLHYFDVWRRRNLYPRI